VELRVTVASAAIARLDSMVVCVFMVRLLDPSGRAFIALRWFGDYRRRISSDVMTVTWMTIP